MAVKFPLKMSDGTSVRTLEELREHFDLEAVLGYYSNGRLIKWLEDRYYDEEARAVRGMDSASENFKKKLCEILGVIYSEKTDGGLDLGDIVKNNERRERLKKYTTDDSILAMAASVAFTQSELDNLLKRLDILEADNDGNKIIYICGEHFIIPANIGGIIYKGVNNPEVEFDGEVVESGIDLQDLKFDISSYIKDCSWDMMHDVFENNLSLGLKLLRQEANQGNADAQFVFGLWCWSDDDIADMTEGEEPMEWWQKAADQGHIEANVFLHHFLLTAGLGGEENAKRAVEWFQKAVEQNSLYVYLAYEDLGQCYMQGIGVEQNYSEAVKWLKRAVNQDDAGAKPQYYLGSCYYFGDGVEQDYKEAVKWFQKAAEQGDAKAQAQLGRCYYEGVGIEEDHEEAAKWYRRAAEQGLAVTQSILGTLYSIGIGVECNFLNAVKWYRRAAEQGDAEAKSELEKCCNDFIEMGIDEEFAESYQKATEQNDVEAQYYLGLCYENGRGTEIDIEEAKEWYSKAADQGNVDAQTGLFRCNTGIFMKQTKEFADMLQSFGGDKD